MSNVVGDEFTFETRVVYDDRKIPVAFRIPKVVEGVNVIKKEDNKVANDELQCAVGIRQPFKNFISKKLEKFQEMYDVRMTLQEMSDEYKLIAHGDKAEIAINELLNICRKSNVYNFYLCLPVRGNTFHRNLQKLQQRIRDILGSRVTFELRPHVTLALINLVTDEDIYKVVNALQMTALSIRSMAGEAAKGDFKPHLIELKGLESIKYKNKYAHRSVLMSNITMEEYLSDITKEFQNCINKTINNILTPNKTKIKRQRVNRDLGYLTESDAIAKGIHITPNGYVEINFTDIKVNDPNASIPNEKLTELIEKIKPPDVSTSHSIEQSLTPGGDSSQSLVVDTTTEDFSATKEEARNKQEDEEGSSSEDEPFEYSTSVQHKFHVTLMRDRNVGHLDSLEFDSVGEVVCVELRPRNGETCNFKAYSTNELINFVGNRYDNRESDIHGAQQISGSQAPSIPKDYLIDINTKPSDDLNERFTFWI